MHKRRGRQSPLMNHSSKDSIFICDSDSPTGMLRMANPDPIVLRFGVSVLVWLILPASLSFGVMSNSDSVVAQFRSTPTNDYYDGMFVAVTASLAFVHSFVVMTQYRYLSSGLVPFDDENPSIASAVCLPQYCHPINALYVFEFLLLLSLSTLNYAAGMIASGVIWTVVGLALFALHFNFFRWCTYQQEKLQLSWIDAPSISTFRRAVLTFFYVIWGIAFIVFPVSQSWGGFVEPFIRWITFTDSGELVWRGIFASYALGFFTCVLDPFNRHLLFILFVAVSGFLHASFMLAANLYSHAHGLPNGNREHLFGDIAGWFVVALFSAAILIGISFSIKAQSRSLNDQRGNIRDYGLECGQPGDAGRSLFSERVISD